MKVKIRRERDGWQFGEDASRHSTYQDAIAAAVAAGHEIDNGGWLKRLLMWNWHGVVIDGFSGWEIERDKAPAYVKLAHKRGSGRVESTALSSLWDDIAEVLFYQRDYTDDGLPTVREGDTYWSGWWFQTIAERDRFIAWHRQQQEIA